MNPAVRSHTLGDLLRRTAARLPDKPAIRCGETAWTYREFDAVVNRLANGLAAGRAGAPVQAGDRVAVLSRNSHAFAALRFALARLGAVLVPINFMLNADEVAYILKHADARLLAVGPDMVGLGQAAAAKARRSSTRCGSKARTRPRRRRA
jgi:fatty-acyl-CoA synthase